MRNLSELQIQLDVAAPNKAAPSTAQIALVEELLGTRLPESFVTFLEFSNGGIPGLNTFYGEFEGNEQSWTVQQFFHLSCAERACTDPLDIVTQCSRRSPTWSPQFLPFAHAEKGDLFFLDLSEAGAGQVLYWQHATDSDFALTTVAASFEQLIDGLTSRRI